MSSAYVFVSGWQMRSSGSSPNGGSSPRAVSASARLHVAIETIRTNLKFTLANKNRNHKNFCASHSVSWLTLTWHCCLPSPPLKKTEILNFSIQIFQSYYRDMYSVCKKPRKLFLLPHDGASISASGLPAADVVCEARVLPLPFPDLDGLGLREDAEGASVSKC